VNLDVILFFALAFALVSSALGVVFSKKMMYCVIFLGALFGEVFALFISLQAEYLAVVQLLIYAGAVTVLFLFALMLTRGDPDES
jgi:NADH-quinone oxidoreductase subunit J